jgi:hypothetical protein
MMPVAGAHYPRATREFLAWFGADEDCLDYLEWLRWPDSLPACAVVMPAGGGWATAGSSAAAVVPAPR